MIVNAMPAALADLDQHRQALFGLCYRMLGSAADADDLVQDTFRRALEKPPKDTAAPLRPWLVTVATRLCIDALRKRGRERYFGPWLPSPSTTSASRPIWSPAPRRASISPRAPPTRSWWPSRRSTRDSARRWCSGT